MTNSTDQEREAFETYSRKNFDFLDLDERGDYENPFVQSAWEAWQARAQLPTSGGAVPDGYALVPVEPGVELLTAMSRALGMHPLSDGSDGSYPITGAQSTVMQCYRKILAAAEHPVSGEQKWSSFEEWLEWELDQEDGTQAPVSSQQVALAKRLWSCIAPPAAQDVDELVEALEGMLEYFPHGHSDGECFSVEKATKALAAHRAQQGEQPS